MKRAFQRILKQSPCRPSETVNYQTDDKPLFSGEKAGVSHIKTVKQAKKKALTRRFISAAVRKHCSRMFSMPSMRAKRRPWFSLASAKEHSMVCFRQPYIRLPLCVFVNAVMASNASCHTCLSTTLLVVPAPKPSFRLGHSWHFFPLL